jgi:hypothetical protein
MEVTDEMLEAAMKVFNEDAYAYPTWRDHVRAMLKAALKAAPTAKGEPDAQP